MFIVILKYIAPMATIEQNLAAHRDFLEQGYQQNVLVASGPQTPRTGGVLISQLTDRQQLEDFLAGDPFQAFCDYQYIEFDPVKYHPDFVSFI